MRYSSLIGLCALVAFIPGFSTAQEAPFRIVDFFDDSLLEIAIELDVADPDPVLSADFEKEDALTAWETMTPPGARVAIVETAFAGRSSLSIGSTSEDAVKLPIVQRTLDVRPETTYRMTAWIRSEGLVPLGERSAGAGVEVFEHATADGPEIVTHQHLPRTRGTTQWSQLDYSFRTSEVTRHVSIRLVPVVDGRAQGAAFYDDVRLVEVPVTAELLQKDAFRSKTRTKPVHPLVKRTTVDRYDYRPAILSPISTTWSVPLKTTEGLRLRLALGAIPTGGATNSKACFQIHWIRDAGGEPAADQPATPPTELLQRCIPARRSWFEQDIDLAPLTGPGKLRFQTVIPAGLAGYWGNPQVVRTKRAEGDDRPNILLLAYDTLRADHLGYDGYRHATPTLDALAKRSINYRRAYAVSPWTAPSLSSIMTSRYPSQHRGGVRIERERRHREPQRPTEGEGEKGWENRLLGDLFQRVTALNYHPIDEAETTLAERLRAAGYSTVGFHSNYNSSGILGLSRGFDRYHLFSGVAPEGASGGIRLVRQWLERRREAGEEGPFFILLHTQDAHLPYRLRPEQQEAFGGAPEEDGEVFRTVPWGQPGWAMEFWDFELLRVGKARDHVEQIKNFYDAEIAFADAAMGALIAEIDEHLPNTAITVVADHGEEFDEHGQFEHGHSLYDEVIRVPFLLRLPGDRFAGTVVEEPVSIVDVAPTLLQLAGAQGIPNTEGRALISADPATRERKRDAIFAGSMLRGADRDAVIDGRFKYVFHHPLGYLDPFPQEPFLEKGETAHTGREELFDLVYDPAEQKDLSGSKPKILARMRAQLFDFFAETAHGVHLRCGGDVELTAAFSETLGHFKTLSLEEDDSVEIDEERRRVVLKLSGDDDDWAIARILRPQADIALRAAGKIRLYVGAEKKAESKRGLEISLDEPRIREIPDSTPPEGRGAWCRVWYVPGGDASSVETLDNEVAEQLKALGYM